MSVEETLIEVVADEQHKIWAHWMKYLFSVCSETDDGSMLIPKEKVDRWQRQMWTPYADLTDAEKESDRHQALKVLPALNNIMLALTDATERAEQAEAALALMQSEMNKIADNLGKEIELLARAERAEAALEAVPVAELRRIIEMHDAHHWSSVESPPLYATVRAWLAVQP